MLCIAINLTAISKFLTLQIIYFVFLTISSHLYMEHQIFESSDHFIKEPSKVNF